MKRRWIWSRGLCLCQQKRTLNQATVPRPRPRGFQKRHLASVPCGTRLQMPAFWNTRAEAQVGRFVRAVSDARASVQIVFITRRAAGIITSPICYVRIRAQAQKQVATRIFRLVLPANIQRAPVGQVAPQRFRRTVAPRERPENSLYGCRMTHYGQVIARRGRRKKGPKCETQRGGPPFVDAWRRRSDRTGSPTIG